MHRAAEDGRRIRRKPLLAETRPGQTPRLTHSRRPALMVDSAAISGSHHTKPIADFGALLPIALFTFSKVKVDLCLSMTDRFLQERLWIGGCFFSD
jgi:hypothetical protein